MMTTTSKQEDGSSKIAILTPGMKEILHQSILHYLHRCGFSKTLKRFQSEAQIQNHMWKASSANLEEIFCKYINACDEGNKGVTEDQSGEILEDKVVAESETKAKKKKSKRDLASCGETEEAKSSAPKKPLEDTMNGLEAKKKPKDKKTKRNQQEVCTKVKPDTENGEIHPDVANEEKKSSKKRKRLLSDENEDQSANMETNQTLEESKEDKVDEGGANGGDKSGSQKSVKKQRNGSAELKMIDAFLRMKIDQVEFAHEKLQDNSYLAKNALHCSRLPAKKERRLHSAHSQSQLTARQPVATALSPRRSPSAGLPLSALAPHCFLVLFQAIWGCVWKVFWCQVEQTRKFLRAGCNTVCLLPKAAS